MTRLFRNLLGYLVIYLPISFALTATGLLSSVTNFFASKRISMMLFNNANKGASGKDATNKVTNPNWITEKRNCFTESALQL